MHNVMQITESPPLITLNDMDDRLAKRYKEPDLNEKPPFVDDTEDSLKCAWCSGWSGSQQVKRVNTARERHVPPKSTYEGTFLSHWKVCRI